ncbi:WD40/YVTN/BNR-like repeat-containing protein [Zobellia galactanivorans]|uniref:Sortilin N-terminal domain-containing protein n=1 Tax=Zobellia galactanivorans (strain DSM 12802 / CCUG 47099 / CIP 106680 / NCIMB 13871 / Dsij) TaxID=63186 RepID=G0L8Q5_ZOBGA|nr:hypothetical protein [Zobellia galactanivorans]CAZ97762.1 Conserved hypothetical protein [Zobellia galactanivorans]
MKKTTLFLVLGCLTMTLQAQTKDFFQQIKTEKIASDPSIEWKNFGPGMSGYCEEFWNHPTDANVMFMGPDMHVSYGTWDNGKSWHSLKDHDGLGHDMKRVLDIEFSLQNPDYGMAIDWNGWVFETLDRGRSWKKTTELGGSHKDVNIDPNDPKSFEKGWYYEQEGTRLSELAVDPTDDNIWYAGAGDFWNVKSNHRSAANPNGIFFKYAAYGCIYKSTDKGRTWKKITKGLHEKTDVGKIIVNPKNHRYIVMATNFGLMRSTDGGLSWKKGGKGLPNNLPRDLSSYYDPKTNEFVLYLVDQTVYEDKGNTVSAKGGVFKSTDGGKSWKDITGNLYFDMTALHSNAEVDRFHKTMGYWFGTSKSESKKKFTALPTKTLPVFNRLVVNPLNKDEIYVSYNRKHDFTFGPGDVWRSLDGGKTWITCARYGPYWKGNKDLDYWKSRNNPTGTNIEFAHLQTYMDGTAGSSGNRMMSIAPNGNLYIGIDQQTLRSTDKGMTWQQIDDYETSPGSNKWIGRGGSNLPGRFMLLETGIKNRRLLCSGEHGLWQTTDLEGWPDKQAVAVQQIEGQVHDHSGNHGAHSISTVAVHPQDPNTIFILSWRQEHRGKLRKTTDGGKTWANIATIFEADNNSWQGLAPQNSLLIDPNNPDTMYFCSTSRKISEIGGGKPEKLTKGGYGFYRSFDGGHTWELSNTGFHKNASVRRIIMHPDQPETLYAALNDKNGGLYMSRDKGSNWEKMAIPSIINSVNNVFIDRNTKDILISTGQRSGTYEEGGVWRSSDEGETWQQIFKAPFVWQAETSPLDPKLIVLSAAGQQVSMSGKFMNPGIYLSTNGGKSWKKINKGLGQPDKIVDVKPDPYNKDVLWCAGWGSGWFISYLNGNTGGWAQ